MRPTGGRRGRRTGLMVRVARDRMAVLFALAESEAKGSSPELADRYVQLARRIGMRYNVRLLPEFAELYCRGCSRFWVEGRTVRTRVRAGRRVRTCLSCGRVRRVPFRGRAGRPTGSTAMDRRPSLQPEVGLSEEVGPRTEEREPGTEREGQ